MKPDYSKLVFRTNNDLQYTSAKFDSAVKVYGVMQKFIFHHTPEPNGNVELLHKSHKKECA